MEWEIGEKHPTLVEVDWNYNHLVIFVYVCLQAIVIRLLYAGLKIARAYVTSQYLDHMDLGHVVSPPQMPVLLKRMYNANIPRAEITTSVPSCPPMLHTIIKPKLSFLKNCFENGMLTSCVLSYAPMLVKRPFCPDLPKYSCAHSQKRHKSFSPHVSIRKSHITVIPHITDSENSVCLQYIHIITAFLYFS